ncbi:MAG: AraC family transcriptional regulator [Bacteroidetes bacterium]|nr:MAG: AraC family transcriptional regulator [Bacteroidota bacterium]
MIQLNSVTQFNTERGQETLHPLVSVLDQTKSQLIQARRYLSELYIIFLKDIKCENFQYGRTLYDYQEESLIFISPGQVFGLDEQLGMIQPQGWVLVFHPDFIRGTSLGRRIGEYRFFAYHSHEALHISQRERRMVMECFHNIQYELANNPDKHSKALIITHIELLLNYCVRFYDRQFMSRETLNQDVLVRFEALLQDYFQSDKVQALGLPTVGFCAEQLHLSANYFGDLVKKETGRSAQEYIQAKVIDLAREKVLDIRKSISEIAYELGFKYPAHFTRFFKQKVGCTPNAYRNLN